MHLCPHMKQLTSGSCLGLLYEIFPKELATSKKTKTKMPKKIIKERFSHVKLSSGNDISGDPLPLRPCSANPEAS